MRDEEFEGRIFFLFVFFHGALDLELQGVDEGFPLLFFGNFAATQRALCNPASIQKAAFMYMYTRRRWRGEF